MNKDFWERINKLEGLAGKATPGEWLISTSDGIDWGDLYITTEDRNKAEMQWIATVDDALFRADETQTDFQKEQNANACYIAAANPAMVLEMIATFKGRLSFLEHELVEKDIELENTKVELKSLEKEADWLAEEVASVYKSEFEGTMDLLDASGWREAARKAVMENKNV